MKHDYLVYLEDMIEAMDKAEIATDGIDYARFIEDFVINFAVVRALEIVGEAAKRLPVSIRDKYPAIPWKKMAGMRDRIIHSYDNVDLKIVWEVVKRDIPQYKPLLQRILAEEES